MSAWTLLVFAGEVILLFVVLGVVLLRLLRRNRRQMDQQQQRINQLSKCQAGLYLEREIAHTRELSRLDAADERAQRLLRMRMRWLQAEQRALAEEGGAKSDYAVLKRALQSLLALPGGELAPAGRAGAGAGASKRAGEKTDDLLARAKTVIVLQKEIIGQLKEQLAGAASAPQDGASHAFSATLDRVSDNVEVQSTQVAKVEAELAGARLSHQQVSEELARLQARREPAGAEATVLVVNRERPAFSVDTARKLIGEMEYAHGESVNELSAMQETNARQRQLILQLEKELLSMRRDASEQVASQELLDKLKIQLRDHENCTAILEIETDNLRARIETLNRIIEEAEHSGDVDIVDHVHREAAGAAMARMWSERQSTGLQRLAEIAASGSVERACPQVANWLDDLDLSFAVFIKGAQQQYWLSGDGGAIDGRVRSLLQSAVRQAGSTWMDVKDGAVFVGASLRLHVADTLDDVKDFEQLKESLAPQLEILDALLFHIDLKSQQPRQILLLKNILEQAGEQIASIDMQHHYVTEECARIGGKLHDELIQYFAMLGLTDIQRECIEGMLDDFEIEINLLTKASKGFRSNLRATARGLKQLNSEPQA